MLTRNSDQLRRHTPPAHLATPLHVVLPQVIPTVHSAGHHTIFLNPAGGPRAYRPVAANPPTPDLHPRTAIDHLAGHVPVLAFSLLGDLHALQMFQSRSRCHRYATAHRTLVTPRQDLACDPTHCLPQIYRPVPLARWFIHLMRQGSELPQLQTPQALFYRLRIRNPTAIARWRLGLLHRQRGWRPTFTFWPTTPDKTSQPGTRSHHSRQPPSPKKKDRCHRLPPFPILITILICT